MKTREEVEHEVYNTLANAPTQSLFGASPDVRMKALKLAVLIEIASQLADLNETLGTKETAK